MLDLQHLRTFVVMVATRSFTRAAKELDCSQSTVTLHIKLLERELGALLFERNRFSKTNVLTVVGRQVFDYSVRLLALADEMKTTVGNLVAAGLALTPHDRLPSVSANLENLTDSKRPKDLTPDQTAAGLPMSRTSNETKSRPFVRHSLRPRSMLK
jgi:hypothetical protein